MPTINVHRVDWTGFAGAPGLSTFYSDSGDAGAVVAALNTFFTAVADRLPPVVDLQVRASGDTIDDLTGNLNGTWSVTPAPGPIAGSSTADYAAPVGASITWLTDAIVRGRRLRGRTFLVPMSSVSFDADGTLDAATAADLFAAADALADVVAGTKVWSRPAGGFPGSSHQVTGAIVADKAAVLRSRRD